MSLGERIYQLRKAKNLSQGDLAELLNVSRQSISKWETNASVPDLDKLIKLSDVFGVSLDELIRGTTGNDEEESESPQTMPGPQSAYYAPYIQAGSGTAAKPAVGGTQRIIGFILLGIGLLLLILLTLLGGWTGLVIGGPLLICSVICLTCRRRAGLWCCWVIFLLTGAFLRMATSASMSLIWHVLKGHVEITTGVVIAWAYVGVYVLLLLGTLFSYRRLLCPWGGKTLLQIGCSGAVFAAAKIIPMFMAMAMNKLFANSSGYHEMQLPIMWYQLFLVVCEWGELISAAVLLTVVAGLIRSVWTKHRPTAE